MMKRTKIDFLKKRKKLHDEIVAEIIFLMKMVNLEVIDFDEVGIKRPRILRNFNKIGVFEQVEVKKIKLEGRTLKYKASCTPGSKQMEKDWCNINSCIAHTFVTEIVEAIYKVVDK